MDLTSIIGVVADMMDGDDKPNRRQVSRRGNAAQGFSLLQPLMQNFIDQSDDMNGRAEDLDDDGILDVLGGLGRKENTRSLFKNMDADQISSIMVFMQDKMQNNTKSRTSRRSAGIGALLEGLQDNGKDQGLDLDDLMGFSGTIMKLFK